MNICLCLGLVLCVPIDRYDDNIGMVYTLAFAPFAVPGIILLVIGLIQKVI